MTTEPAPKTPTLNKFARAQRQYKTIRAFLEWLETQGIETVYKDGHHAPAGDTLLRYFKIDPVKLQQERDQLKAFMDQRVRPNDALISTVNKGKTP